MVEKKDGNIEEILNVKNNERIFISSKGEVFLINTFNGDFIFKFKVNKIFSNLNYNQSDKEYYFLNTSNGVEVLKFVGNNEAKSIGEFKELKEVEKAIVDISIDGTLYFMQIGADEIYSLDLNTNEHNVIKLKEKIELSAFTHNIIDGNIYGIEKNTNEVKRIDTLNGEMITLKNENELLGCKIDFMFSDELGYIYAIDEFEHCLYKMIISINEIKISILGEYNVLERDELKNQFIDTHHIRNQVQETKEYDIEDRIIKKEYINEYNIASGNLYDFLREELKSIEIRDKPRKGILNINNTNGYWAYIPNNNFMQKDSFIININKNIVVEIEINECEEKIENMNMDSIENEERVYYLLNNQVAKGRIENYLEEEFSYSIKKGGKKGIVQIDRKTGQWTYEPYQGISGADKFDILISNKMASYKVYTVYLDILNPKFYIETIVDKESISFDDIIEYKIFVKNTGNVKLENVIIRETLDSALSFEKGSVEINGVSEFSKNPNFIEIGCLEINESVEVSFRGYLNNIIEQKNQIEGSSNVRGEVQTSVEENTEVIELDSNIVRTNLVYGNIFCEDIIFTSDKTITTVGDIIKFKIHLKNNGNTNIDKVILRNLVVSSCVFESDSIFLNGQEYYSDIGSYGIILEGLKINEEIILEYNLKTISVVEDILNFTPTLEYEYLVDYRRKTRKMILNTISVANVTSKIKVEKYFNKESAIIGDIVKCNINITNVGSINAKNISLQEVLDEGIIYLGNLIVNDEKSDLNLIEGIEFSVLRPKEQIDMCFDVKIENCLKGNLMNFESNISYNYMVCSKNFEINHKAEISSLKILKYDLDVDTKISKENLTVGEVTDLEIILKNNGDIELENVVMKYPAMDEFEILLIKIDGNEYFEEVNTLLNIGNILNKEEKKIFIKLKAVRHIEKEKTRNLEFRAEIKLDSKNTTQININKELEGGIEVFNPKLTIIKMLDKEYVIEGEEITMTVILKNDGDRVLEEIVLTDLLSNELEFIEGSILINNKMYENASIISGVNINKLGISEIITLKCRFKVIKKSENDPIVKVKALAIYNYKIGKDIFTNNIESNVCKINISKVAIEIQKTVDKDFIKLGDVVNFDIKIINVGDKDILNALFIDELFEGLELINRSFAIEDEFINNVNVKKGIIIGDIKVAQFKKINYKVRVIKTSSKLNINTKTYLKYSYILSDGANGRGVSTLRSNNIENIDIALSNFKQSDKDEYLKIPSEKPDIDEIDGVNASVEILSTHLVKTPIVSSVEGCILTGYKLLVNGCINEIIEYTSIGDSQIMYSTSYKISFCEYIIMPLDFDGNTRIEVEGRVENVYYKKINKREFFNNATLLLIAKILST